MKIGTSYDNVILDFARSRNCIKPVEKSPSSEGYLPDRTYHGTDKTNIHTSPNLLNYEQRVKHNKLYGYYEDSSPYSSGYKRYELAMSFIPYKENVG